MTTGTGPTLGVYADVVGGYYFGAVLRGILEVAKAAGGRVIAVQTLDPGMVCEDPDNPGFRSPVADARVDAWITIIGSAADALLEAITRRGVPLVMVSYDYLGASAPVVVPDNAGGVRAAVEHLLEHGHRRIAFVGNPHQPDVRERHAAYADTLRAHGIAPDAALFYAVGDNLETGGRDAGARLLADELPATAVMCATDGNALGVLHVLRDSGVDVPGRVALLGFDNDEPGARASLASVSQRFDVIGRTAAQLAIAGISEPLDRRQHVVPTWLVPRGTCGCGGSEVPEHPSPGVGELAARLGEVLCVPRGDTASAAALGSAAAAVLRAVDRAITAEPPDPEDLRRASDELHPLVSRDEDLPALTAVVSQAARACVTARGVQRDFARVTAVHDVVAALSSACTLLHLRRQELGPAFFQQVLGAQYEISLDLLRRNEGPPQGLAWLQRTSLAAGCFGRWTVLPGAGVDRSPAAGGSAASPEEPTVDVVGVFPAGAVAQRDSCLPLSQFPPAELLAAADADPDHAVIVLPAKVGRSDWGWLAVVGPVETRITAGRQSTDQWAALLTVALDNQTMVQSLHEQREDLSRAYGRERRLVEGLRASEERYALALRAANDGLWDWDTERGEIYYSARWKEMLGFSDSQIGTSPQEWLDRVHEDDRPSLEAALARQVSGTEGDGASGASGALEHEHRLRRSDGSWCWVLCRGLRVGGSGGTGVRLVGSSTDITERKQLEAQLRRDATYDSITSLPNRVLFLERLSSAVERAKAPELQPFAVLYLDLDGFKVVNDSLGHLAGDKLLVAVAARLQGNLRDGDIAARIGGDEFAVLLNDVPSPLVASSTAERLQASLSAPFEIDGHHVVVTAGIGIALSATGYVEPEDVLRDADIAMYRAKALGGGTHVTFDVDMHVHAMARLSVEGELRDAIDAGDFELHYQPIVELASRRVEGFEALIRWPHLERGLVMPQDFLGIAEETGLAVGVGTWVLQEGCRQMRAWAEVLPAPPRVSVNVSNRQFWHPRFLSGVACLVRGNDLPPESLCLEITESVIMHNPEQADALMRDLHALGVRLHLDDFGTGYSSLEALHRFELDALKIDQSFVARLGEDERSVKIVRTILLMGQDLEVDVVAEGVESELQAGILESLGCRVAQGELFSRPVPADAALRMLGGVPV